MATASIALASTTSLRLRAPVAAAPRTTRTTADVLDAIVRDAWQPPDRRPVEQWAEEHITAIPYSPNPGPFRVGNSPHLREVFAAMIDPRKRIVSIVAPVQSSKSLGLEIVASYIVANQPGPMLWLSQTDDEAKDQSEGRLQPLYDHCPPVARLMPAGRNRHKRKNASIVFDNGMTLWILGANNKTNLQRRSIRWLIGDETWRWPAGHMAEAEARVTAFGWLGKCIFASQAGEEDDDTDRKFRETDQREWTFACPHCAHRQAYKWENIEWSKDCKDADEQYDFAKIRASTALRCENESCNAYLEDTDETRRRLAATGAFVAQNPTAARENVGFHWNALATMSWGKLAEMYLRAKTAARKGDTTELKKFYQKRLALPWKDYLEDFKIEIVRSGYRMGELWDDEAALDRAGRIIAAPLPPPPAEGGAAAAPRVPVRVLTVDVQMDHFYCVVRSWSAAGASRKLWAERINVWEDIDRVQKRFGIHAGLVFVDANYNSFETYRQCSLRGWTALIGDPRPTFPHRIPAGNGQAARTVERFYSSCNRISVERRTCRMHRFSNLNVKDCLARLRRGGAWEIPDDAPEEYVASLDSEWRVKDKGKWIWKQIGNRPNHFFDCEVMQTAAALMVKVVGVDPGNQVV
ncbi:hypothetical protein DB346_05470 [Verrucomicrobia bacterium LW23]|nr:hypothetical protein DB346_05470 [Verrucomicrobia bacterium LW23]